MIKIVPKYKRNTSYGNSILVKKIASKSTIVTPKLSNKSSKIEVYNLTANNDKSCKLKLNLIGLTSHNEDTINNSALNNSNDSTRFKFNNSKVNFF